MLDSICIYYSYIYLNNLDINYHLVNVDNERFNLLIPDNYKIDYSKSVNDYLGMGNIYFYNNKNNYELNYVKTDYDIFKDQMSKRDISNEFINYRGQHFYERVNDNQDKLYMFFNGYKFKITTNHKYNINELYDMYFILFSVTNTLFQNNSKLLRELTILKEKGIESFCNDIDLLHINLEEYYDSTIELNQDNILIKDDEDYLDYKDIQYKVDEIKNNEDLNIIYEENEWSLSGLFYFEYLGKYFKGNIIGYDEIINSTELNMDEKKSMLENIISQKQNEISNYYVKIKEDFYKLFIEYLRNNINYDIWNKYHLREFIMLENLTHDNENVNEYLTYNLFINALEKLDYNDYGQIKGLFNTKWIKKSIIGNSLLIHPDYYELSFSGLNYYLNDFNLYVDDEYNLLLNFEK